MFGLGCENILQALLHGWSGAQKLREHSALPRHARARYIATQPRDRTATHLHGVMELLP